MCSLKIYLMKAKVGKYIQESICFQLKISFLNITSVAHLFLFNMESDWERCDDGFEFITVIEAKQAILL